jgi:autotransporter-associated beta strand protein
MKNNEPRAIGGASPQPTARLLASVRAAGRFLAVAALMLGATDARAATLTWDAGSAGLNTGPTAVPASGTWDTSTLNWNNGAADVAWTQTSTTVPTNNAIFGGPDGNYTINNAVQIAATNIYINASGYTFTGSGIYLAASGGLLAVAAGKSATISCPMVSGNNGQGYWVGAGAALSFTGNFSGQQPHFGGPTNGTIYLSGVNIPSVTYFDTTVDITNGSVTTTGCFVGYGASVNGTNYNAGNLTISGGATLSQNGGNIIVARGGGTGLLTLLDGTMNAGVSGSTARNLAICNDGSGSEHGTVNICGGTVNVGAIGSTTLNGLIALSPGGSAAGEYSIFNETNGVVNAWGGIEFGAASGTYTGGSSFLTNSGGSLYVGPGGIIHGAVFAPTNAISFSGGTVGALGNWASSLPINLSTLNGNITFQCGDAYNDLYNITLSGPLTGPGGLNVAGTGQLTLSGTNNYAGGTVVSNGTLLVLTTPVPSVSGPVTVDAAQGAPTLALQSSPGQSWSIGALTLQNGSTTLSNSFGTLTPSSAVAPIQAAGNVAFQTAPNMIVMGSAIPTGTYPLITCTGTFSGTLPASVTLPANMTGFVTNIVARKTIALVVTSSPFSAFLDWAVGNGFWDKSTANWKQNGVPVDYADGDPVLFDDTASGASPIIVTNNILVSPLSISADNSAKSYVITGNGSIGGPGTVTVSGGGVFTLTETNTYNGGTTVTAGQLNINNGGDSSGLDSAIGTGPLTIDGGAALDNTSGSNLTLVPAIPETWNGNFSYVGSSNSLDVGLGTVAMSSHVAITVASHNFEVDGSINDNSGNYKLTKLGGGSLTLNAGNSFGGGFELFSGQLNLGNGGALGSGVCTIDGGSLDNYSGADLTLSPASYTCVGSFSYLGSTNNLDLGTGDFLILQSITLNVVTNTLITEGNVIPGNSIVTKTGFGAWDVAGLATVAQNMNLSVNQGTVLLDKAAGAAIRGVVLGLLVQSNALAIVTGGSGSQIAHGNGNIPVAVSSGGVLDLNGNSETVDSFTSTNGILRNGAIGGTSGLTVGYAGSVANLNGTNCVFDVPDAGAVLNINAIVAGSGSLVMTGAGQLDLNYTNTYTGNTTITAGTLALVAPSLSSTSTVTMVSNSAVLNLNFVNNDTNQIGALVINGVSQPPGLYNAGTTTNIIGAGTLLVVPPITTNPLAGPLQFSLSGQTLALSWPTNLGWILQSQTNALGAGLIGSSNAWFDVAGSSSVTATNLTINPTNPTVFFRLRRPF